MKLTAFFDGACSMKRGVAAGAAVIYDDQGIELGVRAKFMRDVTTPVAEFSGLHLALWLATAHAGSRAREVDVLALGDAELIVRQVNKIYAAKDPRMIAMRDMAWLLMRPFKSCEVRELPHGGPKMKRRWANEAADALAAQCIALGRDLP